MSACNILHMPEPPAYMLDEWAQYDEAQGITEYKPYTHDETLAPVEAQQPQQEPEVDILQKLKVYSPASITDWQPLDEVVQGIIMLKDVNILYGASNTGKTFIALELAACIAGGYPFFDRQVESGIVIYVASESPHSVGMRAQALMRHKRYNLEDLFIISKPVDLFDEKHSDAKEIAEAVKRIETETGRKTQLIILDTLARVSGAADENGSDMKTVMGGCDKIRDLTECALLIVHHTGKDAARGERGWSGIRAHIDNSLELEECGGIIKLKATKARDHAKGEMDVAFKLKSVNMGDNNMGPVTTAICEPVDMAEAKAAAEAEKQAKKAPSKHHKGLIDAFHKVVREKGELNADGTLRGVSRGDLMDAFGVYYLTEVKGKSGSIKTTFNREMALTDELAQDTNEFVSVNLATGDPVQNILHSDQVKDIIKHIRVRVSALNGCQTQNTNTDTNGNCVCVQENPNP